MKQEYGKGAWKLAGVVFTLLFLLSSLAIQGWERERQEFAKMNTENVASNYANAIQTTVERALSANYAIAALLHQNNGRVDSFSEFGKEMLRLYPGVDSLQIAPKGIVQEVIPHQSNEALIGHNLLQDKDRFAEAALTKEGQLLVLTGPFPMIPGTFSGAVGRLPIYLTNTNGEAAFWGFSNVVLRFPDIFQGTGLLQLEERGFAYKLWRYQPYTKQEQVLLSSNTPLTGEPAKQTIHLSGATWILSVAPIQSWEDKIGLLLRYAASFVFSLMAAWLIKLNLELKARKEQLERVALFDELTGLPNRRYMLERMEQGLSKIKEDGGLLAVCYIDLDGFKEINDQFGHVVGDKVLVTIGQRFLRCVKPEDTVARMGGDEFVILLQGKGSRQECEHILAQLLAAASVPIPFQGHKMILSASIGVAVYPDDADECDRLVRDADHAMYQVKSSGKQGYCFFKEEG